MSEIIDMGVRHFGRTSLALWLNLKVDPLSGMYVCANDKTGVSPKQVPPTASYIGWAYIYVLPCMRR